MLDLLARVFGNDPKLIVFYAAFTTIVPALFVAWQARKERLFKKTISEEEQQALWLDKQQERLSEEQKMAFQHLRDELTWSSSELKSCREETQAWRSISFRWYRYGNDLYQIFATFRHGYLNERQIWESLARNAKIEIKSTPKPITSKRLPSPPSIDSANGGFKIMDETENNANE